jgi:hypothetical protein
VDTLGRKLALGMLTLIFVGCSTSSGMPTNQSASASNARVHPNMACPGGGIHFVTGSNGTYTVAIEGTCELYAPYDVTCTPPSGYGFKYDFYIYSGGSYGTLSGTVNDEATFTRESAGEVVVNLRQAFLNPLTCKPTYSTYGYVHLTTP